MAAKIEEAREHIRAAEKALKTGLLKWKPDFDCAADEYSQAAQCYRIARDIQHAKEYHIKASEFYQRNRSFFHAAKALETAIIVGKEISSTDEIYTLAENSCHLYQQHGSGDSGANVLDKAGKIIEERAPDQALKLYQHAAEVSATESGQHQAAEYISKASRILVRLGMYDQAVDSIRREIGFHQEHSNTGAIGRLTVAIVLVQLARGDAVAAEKAYKEWGNNCEAAEMQTIEQLLAAYDEEDRESAKRALRSPFIRHMDVEYARLATTVPLPEGIDPMPNAGVRENAASAYVSGQSRPEQSVEGATAADCHPAPPDDEDELC
ncbi:gamma-soluble NSF attachment protein [Plutella xylostella]|uniref:gamma-soluble NSF attachment protein n=1 Tax=Plutella xylostella TaxID=51655 RepID=UPI0005D0DA77|nr:gamma-soluble NSF attachment protein [Plutella xylostella]